MKILRLALLPFFLPVANAADVRCYQDPRTDAMQCIDFKTVRQVDGIRIADLYTGGPNRVRPTGFTMHANCNTGVVHLKDRDGVSFAGGKGNETQAIISLREWACSLILDTPKKPKK